MAEAPLPPDGRLRQAVGALIGLAVAALVAIGEWMIFSGPQNTGFLIAESIGVTGMPVGALLGWRFALRIGRWNAALLTTWMALSAVLLGCALAVVAGTAGIVADGAWEVIASVPQLYAMGLIFFGWYVLPFTIVAAIAWLGLMRLTLGPSRARAGSESVRGWSP